MKTLIAIIAFFTITLICACSGNSTTTKDSTHTDISKKANVKDTLKGGGYVQGGTTAPGGNGANPRK